MTFPPRTAEDSKGLQESGDMLLEFQCVKQDGGLKGFRILDAPTFLEPLLTKLLRIFKEDGEGMLFNTTRVTMWITPFGEVFNFIQETSRE